MNTMESEQASKDDVCPKCGGKKYTVKYIAGKIRKLPVMCDCRRQEVEKREKLEEKFQRQKRLERLLEYSLMDKEFRNCTFENWKMDLQNKRMYYLGLNYCRKWSEMKKKNMGFLFWGPPGTGKTYLSFCIANYLLSKKLVPVIAISTINLINKVYESYGKYGEEGEVEIINSLKNADLLILDDLGAEHDTPKAKQLIYSVIDSRYRSKKPMIVTTNLTLSDLKDKLKGQDRVDRTYDRLVSMCFPVEIKGKSRRIKEAKEKEKIFKELIEGGNCD